MPSASVMTTTAVNAGLWRSERAAYFDVGDDALDPRQPALVADRLGGLRESARCEQRLAPRRVRIHAAPDVLGGLHVEMRLQLLAEIVVAAVAGEESGDARERGANRPHEAHEASLPRRGARKAAIRSAVSCQSRVSRASCLRPAAVSE